MSEILKVSGMSCSHCEARVKKALEAGGIEVIKVSASEGIVEIDGLAEKAKEIIEDTGYDVE